MSISLCMIVKNEENNLPRCLQSVKDIVDEMIIVDTGSTDSTVNIAESFGAKVFHYTWNGSFSDARNHSLRQAGGDWLMIMDADDELEPSGRAAVLELVKNEDVEAYFFETISFVGEKPGTDVLKNMNLRLMRNHKGYFFSNPIHEQIYCNIIAVNPLARIVNKDIRVYHYGYLNKNIAEHNKRSRNIGLLEKELEAKPGHPFTLFNLGSEYYAMGDNVKAIDYFEQAYARYNPSEGFSSHLLLKMVHCYMALGRFDDAMKLAGAGLSDYPGFTDLEYMRGIICSIQGRHLQAIRHFKKCCEMGEAPAHLNVIVGTGTYRPHQMLGDIHFGLDDFDAAVQHYGQAFRLNHEYAPALVMLVRTCCRLGMGQKELTDYIEVFRPCLPGTFDSIVFEELAACKYYDLALEYIRRHEEANVVTPYSLYHRGFCEFCLKKLEACYKTMAAAKKGPEFRVRAACRQALIFIIRQNYQKAETLLKMKAAVEDEAFVRVYNAFRVLMETGEVTVLSEEEKDAALYTPVIFDILKSLLVIHEFEAFEKALNLLNSVSDKTVLLKLAKLYYSENCFGLAYQELIRSIKLFDCIDLEGSRMLNQLKYKGL